jgi:uncharacterized protein YbaR (Trm112 family)
MSANKNKDHTMSPPSDDPANGSPRRSGVDPKLLEILVCPATHGPLEYDAAAGELISRKAGLAYPIRDGIPIMLVSEARLLRDVP